MDHALFTHLKKRHFLAFFVSLLCSMIIVAAMPVYLPIGQTDAIGLPILAFPFLWSALFLHSYIAQKLKYAFLMQGLLIVSHSYFIYSALR